VATYRLKTATTKTAINTTTPAAMIASSTFGIFNASFDLASFDLIQARPALQQGERAATVQAGPMLAATRPDKTTLFGRVVPDRPTFTAASLSANRY
jgi:hypothetical protein